MNDLDKKLIGRLGFDAWAMNIAADAICNIVFPGTGNMAVERKDMNYNLQWDDNTILFSLRAYTEDGWKEWSTSLKR